MSRLSAGAQTEPAKHIAYIGLGSNIEPDTNLPRAVSELRKFVRILCISSAWQAPALGASGPDFLNAVLKIETVRSSEELIHEVLRPIEASLGRKRSANKDAPRTIDIDMLIFDSETIDPHIWDYAHLAVPLAECNPEVTHPDTNHRISEISVQLKRTVNIKQASLELKD